jgi:hypothetical protein
MQNHTPGLNRDIHTRHYPSPLTYSLDRPPAERCVECKGCGAIAVSRNTSGFCWKECKPCDSIGYHGIDPHVSTCCQPGTAGKLVVLAARRRAVESHELPPCDIYHEFDVVPDREPVYLGQ